MEHFNEKYAIYMIDFKSADKNEMKYEKNAFKVKNQNVN